MQALYNYIPQTNHVSMVYNAAAIPCLQFMGHVMLFLMFSVLYFRSSTYPSTMQIIIIIIIIIIIFKLFSVSVKATLNRHQQ
jgi:L-asparagine transporter-like permease